MKTREQKRKQKQASWEKEKTELEKIWKSAKILKSALNKKGCILPFYDGLDSYETEFRNIITWAKTQFTSLHDVFMVNATELDHNDYWNNLGIPRDWNQVKYNCDESFHKDYTAPDTGANMRGCATGFHDSNGVFHTIIQIDKNPSIPKAHQHYKCGWNIPVLLHEIGHVNDFENKINFDRDTKEADIIEGEVYANVFALNECFKRAYYISGQFYYNTLAKYKDATDYRGEVVRRVLSRFTLPNYKPWTDYMN